MLQFNYKWFIFHLGYSYSIFLLTIYLLSYEKIQIIFYINKFWFLIIIFFSLLIVFFIFFILLKKIKEPQKIIILLLLSLYLITIIFVIKLYNQFGVTDIIYCNKICLIWYKYTQDDLINLIPYVLEQMSGENKRLLIWDQKLILSNATTIKDLKENIELWIKQEELWNMSLFFILNNILQNENFYNFSYDNPEFDVFWIFTFNTIINSILDLND